MVGFGTFLVFVAVVWIGTKLGLIREELAAIRRALEARGPDVAD